MKQKITSLFEQIYGRAPTVITRAPGRIEFIGNHTDYNGGPVMGAAVNREVWVAVAPRVDDVRRFHSDYTGQTLTLKTTDALPQADETSWANYPLGVLAAFPVFALQAPAGFDYLAVSDLPAGAGLSSSAAIELASGLAFLELTHQRADRETLVKIGQHAENHFVGVPCGILDQGVSGFGRKDHLVFIDCKGPFFETVPLPKDAHFWIFNTHTKHALVDGLYAARHRECLEAARLLGVSLLADASHEQLAAAEKTLPPAIFRRACHVVDEISRVEQAVAFLKKGELEPVGRLLTASHHSSRTLFENSTLELDLLVETLTAQSHVLGARLTGGGFGGAVMALTDAHFNEVQAGAVAATYASTFGVRPDILHLQTGDGCRTAGGPPISMLRPAGHAARV